MPAVSEPSPARSASEPWTEARPATRVGSVLAQTVPDELLGCWRRDWIRWADGSVDDTSEVIWLQTYSSMADLRLDGAALALDGCDDFADCSDEELSVMARTDSSSGITRCTAVLADSTATATWHASADGVDFQPISTYPEPGILSWSSDGTVMIERAPSGAYVEQWSLIPNTRTPLSHTVLDDAVDGGRRRTSTYVAGDVAMFVRDRAVPLPMAVPLAELVAAAPDRESAEALVDCEFSFAKRRGGSYVIMLSTLPWRRGQRLDIHPEWAPL